VRKVDNLTAICGPIFYRKCGSLDVSQPYGPVTGMVDLIRSFLYSHYAKTEPNYFFKRKVDCTIYLHMTLNVEPINLYKFYLKYLEVC
jgi:hypothetical protein